VPVVSIHSINDPQVVVEAQSAYLDAVRAAGCTDSLVQAFTDERGHTAQSAPELAAGLDALMQWIDKGMKPTAQSIAAGCEQLRASLEAHAAIARSMHRSLMPRGITRARLPCGRAVCDRRTCEGSGFAACRRRAPLPPNGLCGASIKI
jgi:hypothetical protein